MLLNILLGDNDFSSDKITLQCNDIFNPDAWPKSNKFKSLKIAECPTTNDALTFLFSNFFERQFLNRYDSNFITFEILEELTDDKIEKENLESKFKDEKLVIAFESDVGNLLFWKVKKMEEFLCLKMKYKESFSFVAEQIRKCVEVDCTGESEKKIIKIF